MTTPKAFNQVIGKPRISTNPAYSGGKLDVAWTHPETGERLPVVVDLETLEAGAGLPFVLYHDLKKPLGTIEKITKTQSDLKAEGSFTHGHTLYGANELTAARNGFKHRPSVTVYRPETKNVIRVAAPFNGIAIDEHPELKKSTHRTRRESDHHFCGRKCANV